MSTPRRTPSWLAASGVIAVAMGVMNVSTYGFTVVAARLLGPREYGALAAAMGLMLVLGVLSLGFQATAARKASLGHDDQSAEADVLGAAHASAVALTLLLLLATPVVGALLRLQPWWAAALIAAAVLPLTLMGSYAGILQGERRWAALAAVYVAVGAGRLGLGVLGTSLTGDSVGALAGVAAGNALPAVVGWWFVRRRAAAATAGWRRRWRARRAVLTEVAHDSHALLAFFAMSNVDVLLARQVLGEYDAGLYAAGLILTKAVLFLPQFVVVLSFPSMVRDRRRGTQTQPFLVVLAIGAAATFGAWLLSPLAVLFVGGAAYLPLRSSIWAFAAVGALLATIQLLVYGAMAHQQRTAVLLWAGLASIVAAGSVVSTVRELLVAVAAVQAVVLLSLLLASRRDRAPSPTDA